MTAPNQTPASPSLKDLLNLHKADILTSLNCHALGTIQKFNSAKQTVEVSINYQKTFFPSGQGAPQLVDYPLLLDVPVFIVSGGLGSITMPITIGDQCIVLFNDRDIDNWFSTGTKGPLATGRLHSLADGIALIGLKSMLNPITPYDSTRASLNYGTTVIAAGLTQLKLGNGVFTLGGLISVLMTNTNALTASLIAFGGALAGSSDPAVQAAGAALVAAVTPIQVSNGILTTNFSALLE